MSSSKFGENELIKICEKEREIERKLDKLRRMNRLYSDNESRIQTNQKKIDTLKAECDGIVERANNNIRVQEANYAAELARIKDKYEREINRWIGFKNTALSRYDSDSKSFIDAIDKLKAGAYKTKSEAALEDDLETIRKQKQAWMPKAVSNNNKSVSERLDELEVKGKQWQEMCEKGQITEEEFSNRMSSMYQERSKLNILYASQSPEPPQSESAPFQENQTILESEPGRKKSGSLSPERRGNQKKDLEPKKVLKKPKKVVTLSTPIISNNSQPFIEPIEEISEMQKMIQEYEKGMTTECRTIDQVNKKHDCDLVSDIESMDLYDQEIEEVMAYNKFLKSLLPG